MKCYPVLLLSLMLLVGVSPATLAQENDGANTSLADGSSTSRTTMMSLRGLHDITATNLMKTAEMLDEKIYAFRPTEEVRTAGQILAHVANAQFMFCSSAAGEENSNTVNYEETATAKADIVAALRDGLDYCAAVYDGMSDEEGAQMRAFFGRDMAASAILAFNSAHNYEHYGNLVTYMRINGIVPPSSVQ